MSLTVVASILGAAGGSLRSDANRSAEQAERRLDAGRRPGVDDHRTVPPRPFHCATRPPQDASRINLEPRICGVDRDNIQSRTEWSEHIRAELGHRGRTDLSCLDHPISPRVHPAGSSRSPWGERRVVETSNRGPVRAQGGPGAMLDAEADSTHADLRRRPPSLIPPASGEPQTAPPGVTVRPWGIARG